MAATIVISQIKQQDEINNNLRATYINDIKNEKDPTKVQGYKGELKALERMMAQEETAAGFSSLSDIDAWLQQSKGLDQEQITYDNMDYRDFPEDADFDKGEMAELSEAVTQETNFLNMFAPVQNQLTQNIAANNNTINTTLPQMDPFKGDFYNAAKTVLTNANTEEQQAIDGVNGNTYDLLAADLQNNQSNLAVWEGREQQGNSNAAFEGTIYALKIVVAQEQSALDLVHA